MIPAHEIPMTELIDTELEAVCGGLLNFSLASPIIQTNVATQVGVGVGIGGLLGAGIVAQSIQMLRGETSLNRSTWAHGRLRSKGDCTGSGGCSPGAPCSGP